MHWNGWYRLGETSGGKLYPWNHWNGCERDAEQWNQLPYHLCPAGFTVIKECIRFVCPVHLIMGQTEPHSVVRIVCSTLISSRCDVVWCQCCVMSVLWDVGAGSVWLRCRQASTSVALGYLSNFVYRKKLWYRGSSEKNMRMWWIQWNYRRTVQYYWCVVVLAFGIKWCWAWVCVVCLTNQSKLDTNLLMEC